MNRVVKDQIIIALKKRDGYRCMFPGCSKPFSKEDPPTIDHWLPRSAYGDETLENLKLMHFKCNNLKANIVPNEDGSIDIDHRIRIPKSERPKICELCFSGRILLVDEICELCGSGPQPRRFPTAYKKKPRNCSHSGMDHCWNCFLGFVKRIDQHTSS